MATCSLCNKSGWFLRTNPAGLCQTCEPIWGMDVQQHSRIIEESVKIIHNSKNLKTRLSRIGVATRSCKELRKYEQRGIETIATPPSQAIQALEQAKREVIQNAIQDELVKARIKSQNSTTPTGKVSPFNKVIDKIGGLYQEVDDVTELERLEQEARKEMDKARLAAELEKAEKAEFKGQQKKALDAYLDALFVVRKDSIDDALQRKEIAHIEGKIRELGGEAPKISS